MIKSFLLISSAFFALCLPALAQVEPGELAPDFNLKDSKDNSQKLSTYAGKFVVLEWLNP
ncbi:MAG: thioredoxin family protein, partial [Verrucomicrobia bacterium]|nr:thioredoxin family protein [Verrucomicrobiota bacterium]